MRSAVSWALYWLSGVAFNRLPWCADGTPPRLFFWLEDAANWVQGDGPGPFTRSWPAFAADADEEPF